MTTWWGVKTRTSAGRPRSGHIPTGLRMNPETGAVDRPGDPQMWDEEPAATVEAAAVDRRPDRWARSSSAPGSGRLTRTRAGSSRRAAGMCTAPPSA